MNDIFIVGCIFWILVMYLIHRYYKSKCYKEMRRIRNSSVSPQAIVPIPIVNGIEVTNIPESSIVVDAR